jgi:hypothetical protein
VLRGVTLDATASIAQVSQTGWVTTTGADFGTLNGCRADLNLGPGFVIQSNRGRYIGNLAFRNSQETDNAHSGFVVTGFGNVFEGNYIDSVAGDAKWQKNGFDDTNADTTAATRFNRYGPTNHAFNIRGVLYNLTGATGNGETALAPVVFATLGAPPNGTLAYCANCTIANPCAAGGTGALAKRLNSIWICN